VILHRAFLRLVTSLLFVIALPLAAQQTVVPLWSGTPPGSTDTTVPLALRITPEGEHVLSSIHHPSITVYLPAAGTATGVGVLVIPGGGHKEIWIDHEGYSVAAWLSQHGIAAFVLQYRLAREEGSNYTVEGTELQDTQRALRTIRSHSAEWGVKPDHVGVMGFSAGGELAALASTRNDSGNTHLDTIDSLSSKPNFQALIYPAIPKDMRLSKETPPAFLACGANDRPDIAEGLPQLYLSMKQAGVAAELHVFAGVGHGFGIRKTNPANVSEWPELFYNWLDSSGFLKK
jgi:acetyl esterase/lipase